jgi:hypothetical protein
MKNSRTKWWLVGICLTGLFIFFVLPSLLPKGQRWYFLNPKYALWRYGFYHYDKRIIYDGLNGDIWRDDVVRGRTLPELRTMFHNIHEISEFDKYDLAGVSSYTNSSRTFVKWDDTSWFIEITNGKANAIHLWKG